jgi:hypothetical protein
LLITAAHSAWGAELSVGVLAMRPGALAEVVVVGSIQGEATFGVTILVELVPRDKAAGALTFTEGFRAAPLGRSQAVSEQDRVVVPGPPLVQGTHSVVDIEPLLDPWPRRGTCSLFDTSESGSILLNGMVDDNGTYVAAPLSFFGSMASFPVLASPDARGVWDVVLSTSAGPSQWEGVATQLVAGTVTVTDDACEADDDCADDDPCTDERCSAGQCEVSRRAGKCLHAEATGEATPAGRVQPSRRPQNAAGESRP